MGSQTHRRWMAEIHATAVRIKREHREEMAEISRRAREHRTPRTTPVMPDVKVGDRIRLMSNAVVVVAKVNRKSVVTENGVRWTAGEFEVIR